MSFAVDLNRFAERSGGNVDNVVRSTVLSILGEVVRRSPVDTGRFKGNWQLGVGSAPSGTLETTDTSGSATLSRATSEIPRDAAGKVYYIVNNLDYAQALEDGHSRQSPPGNMVAGTVSMFHELVRT